MSYHYVQQYPENFSNPTTPLDAFTMPWETLQQEDQVQHQQAQALQDSQQQLHSEITSPTGALPPTPHYRIIQLDEHSIVPPPRDDTTSVLLHRQSYPTSEIQRKSLRESPPGLHVESIRPSSSSGSGPGLVRQTRSCARSQTVPYNVGGRRQEATTTNAPPQRRQRKHTARFENNSMPSSSMPSPAMPTPVVGSPRSRMASYGSSAAGSPNISLDVPSIRRSRPESTTLPITESTVMSTRRLTLRTDSHYDPETRILSVVFELPGVKKKDVTITLSTCMYNRVKQITVLGRSYPLFPSISNDDTNRPIIIRERQYGQFSRTFAVPADTRRENVDACMEDGVLIVKVPCGAPASLDAEDVPIR